MLSVANRLCHSSRSARLKIFRRVTYRNSDWAEAELVWHRLRQAAFDEIPQASETVWMLVSGDGGLVVLGEDEPDQAHVSDYGAAFQARGPAGWPVRLTARCFTAEASLDAF